LPHCFNIIPVPDGIQIMHSAKRGKEYSDRFFSMVVIDSINRSSSNIEASSLHFRFVRTFKIMSKSFSTTQTCTYCIAQNI
jgi:hypothetical protein